MYLIKAVLVFLVFMSTSALGRDEYIVGFGGYGKHSQDSMKDSKTYPVGLSYGAGLGYRNNFYEFELLASKSNYEVDIVHDGNANKLIHEQSLFNLSMNFYLLRHLYLRLGYGLAIIDQKPSIPVAGASGAGLTNSYGLRNDKVGASNLGVGYIFWLGNRINLYTQYEHIMISELSASQSMVSVGFRWYLR